MRVGVDGLLLWGRYSGVERAIARLAAALPAADPDNEYLIYLPADADGSDLEASGLQVRRAPLAGQRKPARILWQQGVFPGTLRRDGVDLLFAPGYVMPLRWRGASVLLVHDVLALSHPELAARANVLHYRRMLPRSARRAGHVVVPTEHVREQVVSWCGISPEKVATVPLGIEAGFRPVTDAEHLAAVRKRYRLPERFVLYVGNLEPKKNLCRLVEAFVRLRSEGIGHRLVLAGKPAWGFSELEAAIAASGAAAAAISLPGYVPDADLPALYSLADLFVFPSLVEGFGLPPLEAMACGTPVLVGDVPPFPETVGDAGLRVDPRDAEAIAAGMRRGLRDEKLRQRLREAGLRRAAEFTWESSARRITALFREAAGAQEGP